MLTSTVVEKVVTGDKNSLPKDRCHLSATKWWVDQTFATKIKRHNPRVVWCVLDPFGSDLWSIHGG